MNFKDIQSLKARHSKEEFESILLAVEQDLKFNKLSFNKRITNEEFFRVITITEEVFKKLS